MRVVAGLPRLPGPFDPRVEPVGSVRLQRRLEALTPAERGTLETVVAGFDRGRLAGLDDAAVIARVRAAAAVAPPRVRSALEAVWQQRGAAALALRRAAGAPAPDPALFALPGLVPLAVRIVRGWHRPGFALGGPAGEAAREAVAEAPRRSSAGAPPSCAKPKRSARPHSRQRSISLPSSSTSSSGVSCARHARSPRTQPNGASARRSRRPQRRSRPGSRRRTDGR